jgi:DNA-binding transcriptional LysR family regulator
MSPRNPLARRPTLDVTELQDQRVLLLRHGFGVREMFDLTCRIAHVHTHTVLEAGDPHTLIALAEAARAIAIVPSTVEFTGRKVRVAPLLHARASVGMWGWIVWDPKRFLPAFARSFIDEFVEYARRSYPGRQFERRAPPVPRP